MGVSTAAGASTGSRLTGMATNSSVIPDLATSGGQPREFRESQVFERVTLLLAAGVVLLVLSIGRAMARSLSAIMPKRGERGTPAVRLAPSITAKSSAFRAGS